MSRIVVGNRDGTLAVRLGRSVLERLAEEWPDLHLTVKTVPNDPPGAGRDGRTTDSDAEGSWPSHAPNRLVDALTRGAVDVAVIQLGQLSADLPPELTLAAVTRRGDQRLAVVARGYDDLAQVPTGAIVGVGSRRDAAFLRATYPGLVARALTQAPEAELARLSARRGYRLYLLGAAPGVAERAAEVLVRDCPGLQIAGTYAGSPSPCDEDDIVARITAAEPDVLCVAYGAPRQDLWIYRNLHRLGVPVCMGVGGALDFITGVAVRAPVWMRRAGLEWLHRLWRQPWRWRRMLALPRFVARVTAQRLSPDARR